MKPENEDRFRLMLKQTQFVVEATSHEQQTLWEHFCKDAMYKRETNRYTWKQLNPGYIETVGKFHGFPVAIGVFWVSINDVVVMFYEATSRVVDHKMVEKWLKKNCCPKWDNGTRDAHCNAANFHHVLNYIDAEEKAE